MHATQQLVQRKPKVFTWMVILFLSVRFVQAAAQREHGNASSSMEKITDHVAIWHDGVVNVGVIERDGYGVLIESGRASIVDHLPIAGLKQIEWCLYTDHHRDLCAGASRLRKSGVRIAVPADESPFFRDVKHFWEKADTLLDHAYEFRPDLFVLREPVPVDLELRPGDTFEWRGVDIFVLDTPGDSNSSVSYLIRIDGKTFAFAGDLIAGPGQLWNFYRLQKRFPGMPHDYWGFGGAVQDELASLRKILEQQPDVLIGAHGQIVRDPPAGVDLLRRRVDAVMQNYSRLCSWRVFHFQGNPFFPHDMGEEFAAPMLPPLPAVRLPTWIHQLVDTTSYIRAEDGSAFVFDCGSEQAVKALDRLVQAGELSSVEGMWISHYHDDHTSTVNELRTRPYARRARVYAQQEMADILENPRAYKMPCLYPEGIRVDHPLAEGEVVKWKGFRMTAFYFPGQTLYHGGLLISHEGARIFMSGDSFANWGIDDYCSHNRNFVGRDSMLRGYLRCLSLLERVNPSLLVAAHWGPLPISWPYIRASQELLQERARLFQPLFPWEDPNFGLDPDWVRVYPYRQRVQPGRSFSLEVRIYNHSDSPHRAVAAIVAPDRWKVSQPLSTRIAPHTEGTVEFRLIPPLGTRSRSVLGVNIRFGGRDLTEFAEAIADSVY